MVGALTNTPLFVKSHKEPTLFATQIEALLLWGGSKFTQQRGKKKPCIAGLCREGR